MNNLLDMKVGFYKNHFDKTGTEANLLQFLTTPIKEFDLNELRSKYRSDEEFKSNVKPKLPAITPSGLFKPERKVENLVKHTGLMVVDIDFKDQKAEMNIIRDRLKKLEYIAYLGKSCSGKGLFGIMPVACAEKHLQHFLSIEKELLDMDIIIDKSCKDVARLRYYAFDAEAYFNFDAVPYTSLYVAPQKRNDFASATLEVAPQKQDNHISTTLVANDMMLNYIIGDIQDNHINMAENYREWFTIGAVLKNELGEDGRTFYHVISSQSSKYDRVKCDLQYDKIERYKYPNLKIETLYHYYFKAKK